MFSSFFAKDPLKDFAYELNFTSCLLASGDVNVRSSSYWSLHTARKRGSKIDADEFSAFVFSTQDKSPSQVQLARQTFRRFKTLRHPNLVAYIDGVETDKALYIVTNRLVPLSTYLEENADKCNLSFLTSWGTYQVCKAVAFLNNDCKLAHCNVNLQSIFVTRKGEWKLGAFDFCVPLDGSANLQEIEALRFPHLEKFVAPDMLKNSNGKLKTGFELATQLLATDSFGLACLIYEIFNSNVGGSFREALASAERRQSRIPQQIAHFDDLCASDYRARLTVEQFAERNARAEGYFSNFFVSALLFVDEMALKSAAEISRFLSRLDSHLDSFPGDIRENKILAQLLDLFNLHACKPVPSSAEAASGVGAEAQSVQNALLAPIIKIGQSLSVDAFHRQVTPCLIKLFASPDRQTRVKLLDSMPGFVQFLSASVINEQLFGYVAQGFADAHALVRDTTIKSSCLLKHKLNARNLDELVKQLGRVQARDPEGGLRTNAIVCLAKLAGHVSPKTRQSLLLAAFLRATKDQFGPARLSALGALQQTNVFYPLCDLALKVLPCCTPLLVDPLKPVREAALRLVRTCFDKLEKVSDNPEAAEQLERDLNTVQTADSSQSCSTADSTAGWSGWALNALSSKFYKVNTPSDKKPMSSTAETVGAAQQPDVSKSLSDPSVAADDDDDWTGSLRDTLPDDGDLNNYDDLDAAPLSKPVLKHADRKRIDADKCTSDDSGWPDTNDWPKERKSPPSDSLATRTNKVVTDASSWQQTPTSEAKNDWDSDAFFEHVDAKPQCATPALTKAELPKRQTVKVVTTATASSSQCKAKQTDDDGWSNW